MPHDEMIVDEWTSDIEELELEIKRQQGIDAKLSAVQEMMKKGNKNAKGELLALLKNNVDEYTKNQILFLLNLLERHPVQMLLLSIPAMIVFHVIYASVFAFIMNIVILAPKYIHGFKMNSNMEESLSELSILLALGPVYAIRWAKSHYPTILKPVIPWLLLIPVSIVMTGVLMAIYDYLFVVEFMALRGFKINALSIFTNLLSFLNVKSLVDVPIASFFKHILSSLVMIVTISLGYYGNLKKENLDLLEALQVVEKV